MATAERGSVQEDGQSIGIKEEGEGVKIQPERRIPMVKTEETVKTAQAVRDERMEYEKR